MWWHKPIYNILGIMYLLASVKVLSQFDINLQVN